MNRGFMFGARVVLLAMMAMACVVIWGWLNHHLQIAQISAHYVLMQYNTAICVLLLALAAYAVLDQRRYAAWAALICVLLIDCGTLLEHLLDTDLHIDAAFFVSVDMSEVPGRSGLNTTLAILLTAIAILVCTKRLISSRQAMIVAIICSFVFALGAVPLLGYVSGIQEAYRSGMFTRMSLPASCCFVVLATILTFYAGYASRTLHRWAALPVFLGLVTISFSAAIAVQTHERQQIEQLLQERVTEKALNTSDHLHDLYTALNRIGLRWEAAGGTSEALWTSDTQSYVQDLPYLSGISWVDTQGRIQWISSRTGNKTLVGKKITDDPERAPTINAAIASHSAWVTPPLPLYTTHELGYLYTRPLYVKDRYDGTIISVVNLSSMLLSVSQNSVDSDYYYALEHDTRTLLSTLPANEQNLAEWKATATFVNVNDTYTLVIYPRPAFLEKHRTMVSEAVLGIGLLMSTLIALSISLLLRERLQARRLVEAEQFNRTILESANYLIIAADVQGNVQLFNSEAEHALGYTAAEIIGKHTPVLWHDKSELEEHLKWMKQTTGLEELTGLDVFTYEALKYGSVEQEWSFIRRDGSRFPGLLNVTPRYSPGGELLGFLGIIKDMTEMKQQQAMLRASEETFRKAMEQSPIGMALVSPEGRWLEVNAALCEILGYKRNELLVTDFQTITHPDDLEADLDLVKQVIDNTIKSYTLEKRYFHKLGNEINVSLSVSLVHNEDGSPKYFISMIQDISERKKLMNQLQKTNAELEQFAYVASHDLQEPLRMVTSFVGLLGMQYAEKLDAQGKEFVTIAVEAAKRMQALINDLLEYARIGRESQVRVTIDSNEEMRHVLLNLAVAIEGSHAKVTVGDLPTIRGNPVEFLRLMQNLIGNGIKFHRPDVAPEIKVSAELQKDMWVFTVADNGIGLKPEYYERIFQPFKRLHTQQEYHGSGIGLAVCRKIVENFGGRIWIESVVGQGSTIRFTVPVISPIKEEA